MKTKTLISRIYERFGLRGSVDGARIASGFDAKVPTPVRVRIGSVLLSAFFVCVIVLLIASAFMAFFPDNRFGITFRRVIPVPVAFVGGDMIFYHEIDKNRNSIRRFYESQFDVLAQRGFRVDFDTIEGKKRLIVREKDVVNKLIEDRIILTLAQEKGVEITPEDVQKSVQNAIDQDGGSEEMLVNHLQSLYGWSIDEFSKNIVTPSLYRDALEAVFIKERDTKNAKNTIELAEALLKKNTPFEDVAEEYSEGDSRKQGGDLGWVTADILVPELRDSIEKQTLNVSGPIIESSLGYHIVVVSDRKEEGGKVMARVRQIFTRKPSFPQWLSDEKQKKTVWIVSRRYKWESTTGNVIFRDESLQEFERRSLEKSDGDPSMIFSLHEEASTFNEQYFCIAKFV